MKLSEIKNLYENTADSVVYKVSSPNSEQVYYGYTKEEDVKSAFMAGAKRGDELGRGDVRLLNSAGGNVEDLNFELIDVFTNEVEAFMERNDLRAKDPMSITGPSNRPDQMNIRAAQDYPERVSRWKLDADLNKMTARQAMASKAFDMSELTDITKVQPNVRSQIISDLDKLLYPVFKTKWLKK